MAQNGIGLLKSLSELSLKGKGSEALGISTQSKNKSILFEVEQED